MQVKRYKAADMRRALELVRSDLGDDAVILSSNKNGKGVEILATADDCKQWLQNSNAPEPLPEDNPTSVFAKYEAAAEQESLALMSDAMVDDESTGDENLKDHAKSHVDTSYLARQLESMTTPFSHLRKQRAQKKAESSQQTMARQVSTSDDNGYHERSSHENSHLENSHRENRYQENHYQENHYQENHRQENKFKNTNIENVQPLDQTRFQQGRDNISERRRPLQIVEDSTIEDYSVEDGFSASSRGARAHNQHNDQAQLQIDQLQSELSDMREMLEMQLTQAHLSGLKGQQLACDRRLQLMGFGNKFRSVFHRQCDLSHESQKDTAWRTTISYLTSQVRTLNTDLIKSGGQLAFIGPTGAGKTTTIAKLATRFVLSEGRESIALVTLDNERLGSQSQLKSLSKILNIPLRVVIRPEDLADTLDSLDYCRLVLIDTPGVSASGINDDPFIQQLFALPNIAKLLVMACNAQHSFQRRLLSALQDKPLRASVLTKLDETDCLGETLDVLVSSNTPVAYTTDGQNIPDDIAVAKAHQLITRSVSVLQGARKSASGQKDRQQFDRKLA